MIYRELGRTGWRVSTVSFGAWAIGSAWGHVDAGDSLRALHKAVDRGVNFFDTADVLRRWAQRTFASTAQA